MIRLDIEKCIGCGLCKEACLSNAIDMVDGHASINDACVYCGGCVSACPVSAIELDVKEKDDASELKRFSNVWVVMENDAVSQSPKKVSYELLSKARQLADRLGENVCCVDLCGRFDNQICKDLNNVGCDSLILVENQAFERYEAELNTQVVTDLIREYRPSVVLFAGTENGRDLAPGVSAKLRVGLTADCTGLDIDDEGQLLQIRPTYGGNIIASIITPNHRPQMASVRPNTFQVELCSTTRELKIDRHDVTVNTDSMKVKRVGFEKKTEVYKDVSEAQIVIVGGYGLGKENFPLLHKLAVKLGAAVGATRKAVDEGWAPFEIQVGQTGKMIAPDLYICFGVSGALQHTIGIRASKKIIAVNNDPTAPIFGMSDVAILGDCRQILEQLIELSEEKGKEVFSV